MNSRSSYFRDEPTTGQDHLESEASIAAKRTASCQDENRTRCQHFVPDGQSDHPTRPRSFNSAHLDTDEVAVRKFVNQLLAGSQYREIRSLRGDCERDSVVLRGEVSSFHLKQLAQECIRPAIGERTFLNEVQVRRPTQGNSDEALAGPPRSELASLRIA